MSSLWIFEFLELENEKLCKNVLNYRNFSKKKISSAKNEKLHLFQTLENWVILIFGDFDPKSAKNPKNAHFSSEKIKMKHASKCIVKLFFVFQKSLR